MQMRKPASFLIAPPLACLIAATILTAASAQDSSAASGSPPADGVVVYSREVHHSIGDRYFLRDRQEVVTAPVGVLIDTVVVGLEPLSDAETSAILAPLSIQQRMEPSFAAATDGLGTVSSSSGLIATTSTVSSLVGGTISAGIQSLAGALESLSVLSGGGQ